MEKIYENELNELALDFIKFSKTSKYTHPYNRPIHINYDVRLALEKIEIELRERIKKIDGKKTLGIPMQNIIGYLLDRFLKEAEDVDIIIIAKEYITFQRNRSDVKFEMCSSKLTPDHKNQIINYYHMLADQVKPKKRLNTRRFLDYILVGYLEDFIQ